MSDRSPSSFLVGLIGAGIQQSLSPALHEKEGAELGLRYVYRLIDLQKVNLGTDALPRLLEWAEQEGFVGLNITHPCKQVIIPLMNELSPDAEALNAVNTVLLNKGLRSGCNTDWWGFAENFKRTFPDVSRVRVVQLGAGGAGSAVAHAALTVGVEQLEIFDTVHERAEQLALSLSTRFGRERVRVGENLEASMGGADGVINSTPVGMNNYPGVPVPVEFLRAEMWVAEVVYVPLETELLRRARALGCRTMDGGGMAVFQAAEAFRLFTGVTPNVGRMLAHFDDLTRGVIKM